jgi:hypothetical protein
VEMIIVVEGNYFQFLKIL